MVMNDSRSLLATPARVRARTLFLLSAVACLGAGGLACSSRAESPDSPPSIVQPVIMVSFDGFRWDYPDRGFSPNLSDMERRGVRADGLIPSFPTKTFPNHYTLVTGLVPDHHGIVANTMWDPEFEAIFSMSLRAEVRDARWWGGEPVWVAAEKIGRPTAPLFWPGSEAPVDGYLPTHWLPFDGEMPHEERVDWVLDLLDLPPAQRPVFLTLYFSTTDHAGHFTGPESPETNEAIRMVDAALGRLLQGLRDRGIEDDVNVIVVSDHGMIETSRDRVIFIDDYIDLDIAEAVDWNPILALWPTEANLETVYEALKDAHPELAVYRRTEIPPDLHYGTHRRTPPILGVASAGWTITNRPYHNERPDRADGGGHGYDPAAREMQGIFVGAGPSFRRGMRVPAFRNVNVYPLLMAILQLPARPVDGDLSVVSDLLAE